MVLLKLNSKYTEFCIDIGAKVSSILESTYKRISSPELQSMDKVFKSPNNCRFESAGWFRGMLQKGDKIAQEDIYVVKNLHRSLLGKPAIEKLHILARIGSVKQSGQSTVETFFLFIYWSREAWGRLQDTTQERSENLLSLHSQMSTTPTHEASKKRTGQNG